MVKGHRVTITDEPTRLTFGTHKAGDRNSILVKNLDPDLTIDWGDDNVASGEGYPIEPGRSESVDLQGREDPYAVAPAGESVVVAVFESGI